MKLVKKFLCLTLALACTLSVASITVSAAEDAFSWKEYDKGYVSFVIDDVYSETTQYIKLFEKYNMPMCEAVPAYKIIDGEGENPFQVKQWLTEIQNHGGEILAHNYTVFIIIGAAVGIVVIAAVIVLIIVLNKKKKK